MKFALRVLRDAVIASAAGLALGAILVMFLNDTGLTFDRYGRIYYFLVAGPAGLN